jgi:hypothetical protein
MPWQKGNHEIIYANFYEEISDTNLSKEILINKEKKELTD